MKKMPTLFKREYANHKVVGIKNELSDQSLQCVLNGECTPTIKVDGSCTAIIDGKFYKRFDAKINKKTGKRRQPPKGAVPCQDEPDEVTGHWPHWVPVDKDNPADKWYWEAYKNTSERLRNTNWTYEAVGTHFQGNPYNYDNDFLVRHGFDHIDEKLTSFDEIKEWLSNHNAEGIVFWKDDKPLCKIKRTDFGFEWPIKKED